MKTPAAISCASGLLAVSGYLLSTTPDHFVPFGTMYEPEAFYGSGNLYLNLESAVIWTIALTCAATLLASMTRGVTESSLDRLDALILRPDTRVFVATLCLGMFITAVAISWLVFDHHPRDVDHVARVFQAKLFANGQLTAAAPPLPEFFSVFAVLVHNGEMFSKYAPGGALFFAISEALTGSSLFINPILGAGSAGLIFLAFRTWFDERSARLTLLLLALSPWFTFMIASLHSHVPALFLFSLILYLFSAVRPGQGFSRKLVLAGLAGGLFVATREYTSVLICLPLVLFLLAEKPGLAAGRLAALAAGAALPVGLLLAYNWRLTGDPLLFPHLMANPGEVPWFGYRDHTFEKGLNHLRDSLLLMNVNLLGWPISWVLLPFFLLARSRMTMVLGLCFITLAAGYFANYWNDYSLGARYYFESIPILAGLSAIGFWQLHDRAISTSPVFNRSVLLWFAVLGYGFSAAVYLPRLVPVYANHYNGNIDTKVVEQVNQLPVRNVLVFCSPAGGENDGYAAGFLANPLNLAEISKNSLADNPSETDVPIFARDLGPRNNELIARFPGRHYYLYRYDPVENKGELLPMGASGEANAGREGSGPSPGPGATD